MKFQRRINHTGRKRIAKGCVDIVLEGDPGSQRFTAAIDFDGLELPAGSPVVVEAYQSGRYALQRFDCGTVSQFSVPSTAVLTDLDRDQPIQFRIKVIDTTAKQGRLIAAAKGIRASNEQPDIAGRQELLTVWSREMAEVPWTVNFQEDTVPELALNTRIPGAIDLIKHDPLFQALVFPGAIRSVLHWIYWNDLIGEGQEEWVQLWLDFAGAISGEPPPRSSDPLEVSGWIEDVVVSFSRKHSLCERLVEHIGKGSS